MIEREREVDPEVENARLLAENQKLMEAMRFLRENAYFKIYQEYLQQQLDLRIPQVLQMPKSADDVIMRTYVCGEVATYQVVIGLPEVMYEAAKQMIAQAELYAEHDKEERNYNVQIEEPDSDY